VTAIQRWYLYSNGPHKIEGIIIIPESPPQQWCKAEDVAELERLLADALRKLDEARQSRVRAKADLSIADAKIASLEQSLLEQDTRIEALQEYQWMYEGLCK
jgi:hypothetical protein